MAGFRKAAKLFKDLISVISFFFILIWHSVLKPIKRLTYYLKTKMISKCLPQT